MPPSSLAPGAETLINGTIATHQSHLSMIGLAGGGYVAVWDTGDYKSDIRAQRLDAAGAPVGGEIAVNTLQDGYQATPAVAALADGGYVVVWASDHKTIQAQRFDAIGAKVGGEVTLAGASVASAFGAPIGVAGLSDGGFALVWESWGSNKYDILTQRFDAGGVAAGPPQNAATLTADSQTTPEITALADGGYVVVWQSSQGETEGAPSGWGIKGQRFDATGAKVGGEFQVNAATAGDQYYPSTAALADGGFVVVWGSLHDDVEGDVYLQRFDAAGAKVGGELRVNTYNWYYQGRPDVVGLADGGFVVAWESRHQDGSEYGIYAQRFDAAGTQVSSEVRLNDTTAGDQVNVVLAARSDGGFSAAWTSGDQSGNGAGIFGRAYVPRPEIRGTTGDDTLTGTVNSEILSGLDGHDTLFGGGGDWLYGGRGEDLLVSGAGADALYGHLDAAAGDDAMDTASYEASAGGVYVNLAERRGRWADAEGDRLSGIERVIGSKYDDHLVGQEAVTPWGTYFDAARYLASNPDLRAAFGTDHARATRHWETTGHLEARHGAMMVGGSILAAGAGNDTVHGGIHNDYLLGGTGNDRLEGQGGHDWLYGEAGSDTLNGGDHGDRLYGGTGSDTLDGGSGDDSLYGGSESDTLRGGDGVDRIHSGLGSDTVYGGLGNDLFIGTAEELIKDHIQDFARGDRLVVLDRDLSHLYGTKATSRITLGDDWWEYVTLSGPDLSTAQFRTHWDGTGTTIWLV
ncbi:MAG TPA: calcium-binding protein [Azospirillaceae bacterium]|nr:calcium-binding protein [Azospirillaceae bacterium]